MSEVKKTGHVYDGIEELDHAPPFWFRALFYLTIIYGVGYFFYYTLGGGPTLTEEYVRDRAVQEYSEYAQREKNPPPPSVTENDLDQWAKDPEKKSLGAAVFKTKCTSCHGLEGQGGIGPNLTDAYWIHGGTLLNVFSTISKGVLDKGMPPWESLLSRDDIQSLTAFIRSIQGSHPAGAKEPQGTLVH